MTLILVRRTEPERALQRVANRLFSQIANPTRTVGSVHFLTGSIPETHFLLQLNMQSCSFLYAT
jgi:hypothetical protein